MGPKNVSIVWLLAKYKLFFKPQKVQKNQMNRFKEKRKYWLRAKKRSILGQIA